MSQPPHHVSDDIAVQARDWLLRLASGVIDDVGMQDFEQWLALPGHRHTFEYERVLWRSLGPPPAPLAQRGGVRRRRGLVAVAAVALLACVLMGPQLLLQLRADHRAGVSTQQVMLPDGSQAVLDAGAAIALHFDAHTRRIELLRGRAWFEVANNASAPFQVTVGEGVVEDISTAFVVSREAGHVDAAVEQGRVRVAARPGTGWMYLGAGQAARWEHGGAAMRQSDQPLEGIAAWRRQELLLDAVPVDEALRQLGRYRSGHIFVRGDLSMLAPVNAAFRIDHPEQALDALAVSSGLSVTRLPLGVAIVQLQH